MPIETTKLEKRIIVFIKLFFLLLLVHFSYQMIIQKVTFSFLDNANLMIHEAGHVVSIPFGEFINFLGGTIMQLLIPFLFILAFGLKKDFFAVGFSLLWFGENFINVSYYVADARTQDLPLLAGEHDWAYLLGRMNLLQSDQIIGKWLFFLGAFLMISGLIVGFFATFIDYFRKDSETYGNDSL